MRVRNRRTWRKIYYAGVRFVWRKDIVFEGVVYYPGDPIPEHLYKDKGWLRRRWYSRLLDRWKDFPYAEEDSRRPGYVPPAPDPPPAGGQGAEDMTDSSGGAETGSGAEDMTDSAGGAETGAGAPGVGSGAGPIGPTDPPPEEPAKRKMKGADPPVLDDVVKPSLPVAPDPKPAPSKGKSGGGGAGA